MTTVYATRVNLDCSTLWQEKRPLLGHLDIELTERCNLNCIHCYINQPAGDRELQALEMTTVQVKAVLTEAAELGALSVRFTGGEPLLRPDFRELYLYARKLGLKVTLFTNGTLLTSELVNLFGEVPPLRDIEITVYGMSAKSYTEVTGVGGAFRTVQQAIALLTDRRIPFQVKSTILPPNQSEAVAFEQWAHTLPEMESGPVYAYALTLRGRRDLPSKNEKIEALRATAEQGWQMQIRKPEFYPREMEQFCRRFMFPPGDRLFRCGAGRSICVDAYGKVQPCMLLRDPRVAYDLKETTGTTTSTSYSSPSLRSALIDFFPFMRERRAENPEYMARCARCFLHGLCNQCPAQSWMEHGTLDTPVEYECQVAHAKARELGLLSERERGWEVVDWKERLSEWQPIR